MEKRLEETGRKQALSVSSLQSKIAGDSSDLGSRSDVSSFENEGVSGEGFTWKSQFQHAMYFIAYTFSWGFFSSFRDTDDVEEEEDNAPTWLHFIFTYVIFAGPMLYLQIFIGQYTHKGCIVLGAMLPLAYGIGYCILLNTLINCCLNMYFCSLALYYTFISMMNYPTPSWMLCLSEFKPTSKRCFSRDEIDLCPRCWNEKHQNPCFDPDKDIFSASLFKDNIILGIDNDRLSEAEDSLPSATQIFHLLITTIIVVLLVVRSLKELDDLIRIWNIFAVVTIILTFAVLLLNHPRFEFLQNMFHLNIPSLFSMECWRHAFTTTALRLNMVEGGHFLFGSYMPLTVNCTNRVFYLFIIHLGFLFLCNVMASMMEDFAACSMNIEVSVFLRYTNLESTFAIYPTALGILAAAQLWATLYFLLLFSLTLHSVALQIILVQETLSQEIIDPTYYIYTRIVLVAITAGSAIFFASPKGASIVMEVYFYRGTVLFILVLIIYFIIFLYGLDRFSDDINFILHSPPSKYLKWSWSISGILSLIFVVFVFSNQPHLDDRNISIALTIIVFFPMPVGFFFQLFRAVRAKELSKLVKSAEEFGPDDSEQRANRRLFNPRFEVRFRRRRNFCKHRCLLDSVVLRKCLEKELTLLTHVLLEIEDNEEERDLKKDFVKALRKHKEIMTNALHFDPTKEYFRNRKSARYLK